MLTSITLENFKSFGERQTIPLEPITVLVGPNNSGKSAFMSVGELVRRCVSATRPTDVIANMGGSAFLLHRPTEPDDKLLIEWIADNHIRYQLQTMRQTEAGFEAYIEVLYDIQEQSGWYAEGPPPLVWVEQRQFGRRYDEPFRLIHNLMRGTDGRRVIAVPLTQSRTVKLALSALREDARVVPSPSIGEDGSGIASVLALWRGSDLDRAQRLDDFLRRCLPEIKHALVRPAPKESYQRLWIQQTDGELFDAEHLSDGVMYFIGLAMHIIDAPPESVLFIEEPENSIHPRRLSLIIDALRAAVAERKCQFVLATHSPVVLNEFRDEPEAILLFRRGEKGTQVTRLADVPRLVEALQKAEPGEMLANGFFNDPL